MHLSILYTHITQLILGREGATLNSLVSTGLQSVVLRLYPFEKVQLRKHGGSHQFYGRLVVPLCLLKQQEMPLLQHTQEQRVMYAQFHTLTA